MCVARLQVATLIFSFVFFPKPFGMHQALGFALLCGAVALELRAKSTRKPSR